MQDTFEYVCVREALDTINVEDIGNVCLKAYNDWGQTWYLCINTELGDTYITQLGPIIDDHICTGFFDFSKLKMPYSEKKLHTIIDKFLNDTKRSITQAFEITTEEFIDVLFIVKDSI